MAGAIACLKHLQRIRGDQVQLPPWPADASPLSNHEMDQDCGVGLQKLHDLLIDGNLKCQRAFQPTVSMSVHAILRFDDAGAQASEQFDPWAGPIIPIIKTRRNRSRRVQLSFSLVQG